MKTHLSALALIAALTSCNKPVATRSPALRDNVVSDKPIVLKEGQTITVMKEGDRNLMITIGAMDGRLSIMEIDPAAPNFEVFWKSSKKWETTTTIKDGQNTTILRDRNMDGLPDFKFESTPSGSKRFDQIGEKWVELKSTKKDSE